MEQGQRQRRTLFIDFDGVLHSQELGFDFWDLQGPIVELRAAGLFEHTNLLHEALKPFDSMMRIDIRVHSSWRKTHPDDSLRRLLGDLAPRFTGATHRGLEREDSIRDFVRSKGLAEGSYRALDDQPELMPMLVAAGLVIACDPVLGISEPRVIAEIVEWLRGPGA